MVKTALFPEHQHVSALLKVLQRKNIEEFYQMESSIFKIKSTKEEPDPY
jgi:hypothetical protein